MMNLKTRLFMKPTLELKKILIKNYLLKGLIIILAGNSKLKPIKTDYSHYIKFPEFRMGIKLHCLHCLGFRCLAKIPNKNFKIRNCLFRATSVLKNRDKEKYVYSCYE